MKLPLCFVCGEPLSRRARAISQWRALPGRPAVGVHCDDACEASGDPLAQAFRDVVGGDENSLMDFLAAVEARGPGRVVRGKSDRADPPRHRLTKRRAEILMMLRAERKRVAKARAAGHRMGGVAGTLNLRTLGASHNTLQAMYYAGLVMGYGSRDHRGAGNTPDSSWWEITEKGLAALAEHEAATR